MANSKSIYDVYFEAGESAGEYESSKSAIGGVWDWIGQSREDLAFEQQKISETIDTLTAATELGAQYFGGKQAQKEFESSDLPAVQKEIAKQQYEKQMGEGAPSWDELDKNEQADIITSYTPTEVGAGGKLWDTYSKLEKLFEKPLYRFGGQEEGFVFNKSDVMGISQFSKYGMTPKLDVFKTSLYGEATHQKIPSSTLYSSDAIYTSKPLETSIEEMGQMSGEIYNEPPPVNTVTKQAVTKLPESQEVEVNKESEVGPYKGGYKYSNQFPRIKTGEELLSQFPYKIFK